MAKLYFSYSTMNAGKSTLLLQASYNYRERGMRTLLFTSALYSEDGIGRITSRIGISAEAETFTEADDLYDRIHTAMDESKVDCVLVDEAQFLTRAQVFQLARVADEMGIPVLAYGLRTDFRAELFEGSRCLLALADVLVELKAVCACGRKATMNLRIDAEGRPVREGAQTEIGGNDRYVALCRRHFMEQWREPAR